MKTIRLCVDRLVAAEGALIAELERSFPMHSRVRFYIMHGQVTPSRGEVIRYEGGRHAYLRVRLESRTRQIRSVPAKAVISVDTEGPHVDPTIGREP